MTAHTNALTIFAIVVTARTALADPSAADHAAKAHHVSILSGVASNRHLHETAITVGAGYRYLLAPQLAVGPMVDLAFFDSETTTLLIAAAFWRPVGGLLLVAGPGIEWIDHKGTSHPPAQVHRTAIAEESGGVNAELALRLGVGYELHLRHLTLTPAVGTDVVDSHATMIAAVSVGVAF